jgi:hypothetical protein
MAWILTTRGAPNTLEDGPHSADQLPSGFQSGEVAYMAAQRTSGRAHTRQHDLRDEKS